MKSYCPKCSQIIDETEFMQYKGYCYKCRQIIDETEFMQKLIQGIDDKQLLS